MAPDQASVAVAERAAESVANPAHALAASSVLASVDEDDQTQESQQCVQALREGKRCAPLPPPPPLWSRMRLCASMLAVRGCAVLCCQFHGATLMIRHGT